MDDATQLYIKSLFTETEISYMHSAAQTFLMYDIQVFLRNLLVQGALPTELPRIGGYYRPDGSIQYWIEVPPDDQWRGDSSNTLFY